MEINKLLQTIEEASSRMRLKEISSAVEALKSNNSDLSLFLLQNDVTTPVFTVVQTLIEQQTNLTENRIPLNLVKNIYDQYSIIYLISTLESTNVKSERNKLIKMFREIITNSAKFDIYSKVVKNTKLVSSADSQMNELFWLIPLFSNTKLLTTFDYNNFIEEMKLCSVKIPDYILGYAYYVTINKSNIDKEAYKLFLTEGIKTLKK